MPQILSKTRKNLLVYWYQYHLETNLWPSFRSAGEALKISHTAVRYHVKILIREEWMIEGEGKRSIVGLSKYGESKLFEAFLVGTGRKEKEDTTKTDMLINKIKRKSS